MGSSTLDSILFDFNWVPYTCKVSWCQILTWGGEPVQLSIYTTCLTLTLTGVGYKYMQTTVFTSAYRYLICKALKAT